MSMLSRFVAFGGATQTYVDDVFSTYLYTGNGSTQTINNGIDLAGKGGLVWLKARTNSGVGDGGAFRDNVFYDTTRGANKPLTSSGSYSTSAELSGSGLNNLYAFTSNGFSLGATQLFYTNASSETYASWTFRNADRFFTHTTISHTNGTATNINLSSLGTVGQVHAKITNTTGDWIVWHRSLTAGNNLRLNTTAAQTTTNAWLSVSGTTATLSASAPTGTYVIHAWAHDTSADGIIQCGSFTGNTAIDLGWEPQFIVVKRSSSTGNWFMHDSMRGLPVSGLEATLFSNLSNAEDNSSDLIDISTTGFSAKYGIGTYIYLAIRRPNKPPTSGTQVYNAIARTGTGAAATVTGVGFAPDLVSIHTRTGTRNWVQADRLRGTSVQLSSNLPDAEVASSVNVTSLALMDGITLGTGAGVNAVSPETYINHFFRRAPGFFDQICHNGTGTNKTEPHNLTVQPELWLFKRRNNTGSWVWGSTLLLATEKIVMPSPNGRVTDATAWNSTYPTASNISLGTLTDVNASGGTFTGYLWASLAGISKVFTYTGNGTSQTIGCGFAAGARFVMIIRVTASTAQDIFVWDSARGIIAGNDPHLSLNTTAAEVTTDDSIDPDSSGFIVNQVSATNINVNAATYIYLAIA